MDIAEVHRIYTTNQFKSLSLDDILVSTGFSHIKLRQYCHQNKLAQPPISPGLIDEMQDSDMSRKELAKHFRMPLLDTNAVLYSTKAELSDFSKNARAAALRAGGATEADLASQGLPMDQSILAKEVTTLIANGSSRQDLSVLYGLTPSRISQLNQGSQAKPRISKKHKQEIRANKHNKTAVELAKQYNTTKNTIHVTQREK